MTLSEEQAMVAPCGIHCGICELHLAGTNEELRDFLIGRGIPAEVIPCAGCRAVKGQCPVHPGPCATYKCIQEQGLTFCSDCDRFPCNRLQPCADRASILPHNLKVFQLSIIAREGVDAFLRQATHFKKRYYQGTMEIGNGPQEVPHKE